MVPPPPKPKSRGSSSNLNIFLKEGDWKVLKMQLLKLSKKISSLESTIVALKKANDANASSLAEVADSVTPDFLKELESLLVPRINREMIRINSKKYKVTEVYKDISVYRNGQRVGDYTNSGPKEITFGSSITVGESEIITCDYSVVID